MADAAQEKAAESNMGHGLGDVDTLIVGADRPAPALHPGEGLMRQVRTLELDRAICHAYTIHI